jgi:hypothetical protein
MEKTKRRRRESFVFSARVRQKILEEKKTGREEKNSKKLTSSEEISRFDGLSFFLLNLTRKKEKIWFENEF